MTDAEHREFASFARMYGSQWKKQIRQRRMDGRLSGPAATAFNKIGPSGLIAYRLTMANKVANPATACSPVRRGKAPFNSHEGQGITYRGTRYRIMGCGTGATARRSIGKQEEGTYALLNEKTNKVRYVAKRVVRDILYRRGREGAPAPRGPRTAAKRKGAAKRAAKMSAAKKRAFVERMAAARAAKGR